MKKHAFLLFLLMGTLPDLLQAQSIRNGKDYAIFFYVTKFKDHNWAALPETKQEVTAIANELKTNYGFQVEIVANPTRQEILDKITQVSKGDKLHVLDHSPKLKIWR